MPNEYYDHTTYPSTGASGSSSAMRAELNTIEAGFDKLPTMAGNGGEIVKVNSGGTALETQAADAMVAATINAATSKSTPVDADELGIVDSAASNVLKKLTWANLKATMYAAFGALIAAGTGKTTPVDADSIAMSDSAAANATKTLTFANLWTWIQSKLASPGAIGGTTPAAGAFTTLSASTSLTLPNGKPAGSSNVHIGIATRDLTLASGDVAYTGFGGTPKSVEFFCAVQAATNAGRSEGASNVTLNACRYTSSIGGQAQTDIFCIVIIQAAGAQQTAVVKSFDADGLTLTWTKTGAPTGTGNIFFIARF